MCTQQGRLGHTHCGPMKVGGLVCPEWTFTPSLWPLRHGLTTSIIINYSWSRVKNRGYNYNPYKRGFRIKTVVLLNEYDILSSPIPFAPNREVKLAKNTIALNARFECFNCLNDYPKPISLLWYWSWYFFVRGNIQLFRVFAIR